MLSKSLSTILIVEDDESIRELMVHIMENNEYFPLAASCSEEALEILRTNDIDLAVIDYGLPTDDGLALAGKIEALKPGLPIILMSGLNVKRTDWQIQQAGVSDVLQKPFKIERLMEKLRDGLAAGVNL